MDLSDELAAPGDEPPFPETPVAQASKGRRYIRVTVGTWEFSAAQARHPTPRVRAIIECTRKRGLAAWCFCRPEGLTLVPHAGEQRAPYLSALRDEAYLHADDCWFGDSQSRTSSGRQGDHRPGHRLANGKLQVELSTPLSTALKVRSSSTDSVQKIRAKSLPVDRVRVQATPLGLTLGLFEDARLTEWDPSVDTRRTWADVSDGLERVASEVQVGSLTLSDRLLVRSTQWGPIKASLRSGTHTGRIERALAIGEVKSIQAVGQDQVLVLTTLDQPLRVPRNVWDRTRVSFSRIASALNRISTTRRVVAVVMLELNADDQPEACRLDLLLTSQHYIPADSQQEVIVINKLVAEGRWFLRPVFREAGQAVVPDIILLDAGAPLPMEIFGFWTAKYKQRTEEKIVYYKRSQQTIWAWFVDTQVVPPAFPAKCSPALSTGSNAAATHSRPG